MSQTSTNSNLVRIGAVHCVGKGDQRLDLATMKATNMYDEKTGEDVYNYARTLQKSKNRKDGPKHDKKGRIYAHSK